MISLSDFRETAKQFASENASSILTGVGVIGTVATAVLTARAVLQAEPLIRKEQDTVWKSMKDGEKPAGSWDVKLPTSTTLRIAAPYFAPPVVVGGVTIASIISANRISTGRLAAMAAAYSLSEGRFADYRTKVEEKVGIRKATDVQDAHAQSQIEQNPSKEVIVLTSGDVLCYDMLTGRYFRSTVEEIKRAENELNEEILDNQYVSLTDFYDRVGLEGTTFTDDVGWNQILTGMIEVKFSVSKTKDNQPCIAVDFAKAPVTGYQKLY